MVRFPHPSGLRGKKRPAVVVQSDDFNLNTVMVSEVTKNLTLRNHPACLFIDVSSPEGKATGLVVDSVASDLVIDTVYADTIAMVLGSLSPDLIKQFDACLKAGLGLT